MYTLLSRIKDGLEPLKTQFEAYVKAVGQDEILKDAKNAAEKPNLFVEILLRIFRKYTDTIKTAFKGDVGFVASMDKVFHRFASCYFCHFPVLSPFFFFGSVLTCIRHSGILLIIMLWWMLRETRLLVLRHHTFLPSMCL